MSRTFRFNAAMISLVIAIIGMFALAFTNEAKVQSTVIITIAVVFFAAAFVENLSIWHTMCQKKIRKERLIKNERASSIQYDSFTEAQNVKFSKISDALELTSDFVNDYRTNTQKHKKSELRLN